MIIPPLRHYISDNIQLERARLVLVSRARSQTNLRASRLSMFQLQAEHRHAAELIDLLVANLFLQMFCHTSKLLTLRLRYIIK